MAIVSFGFLPSGLGAAQALLKDAPAFGGDAEAAQAVRAHTDFQRLPVVRQLHFTPADGARDDLAQIFGLIRFRHANEGTAVNRADQ